MNIDDPGDRRPIRDLLDRIRMRLDALSGFGPDVSELRERLAKAEAMFSEGRDAEARLNADELMILLKLLGSEMSRIIREFSTGKPDAREDRSFEPGDERILELVEEAFKRSLHSVALRRMVEVIAVGKIQSILSGEFVTREELSRLLPHAKALETGGE